MGPRCGVIDSRFWPQAAKSNSPNRDNTLDFTGAK
jgi:hypothetical protein